MTRTNENRSTRCWGISYIQNSKTFRHQRPNRLFLPTKVTEGKGALSQVKSIQRLSTLGGRPPAEAPDKSQAGKELRVYYSATYYFSQ
jgi:hypothetical protein